MIEMDGEQWVELLKVVIEDMQGQPGKKGVPSFPLAPAAKGKSGKVCLLLQCGVCNFIFLVPVVTGGGGAVARATAGAAGCST